MQRIVFLHANGYPPGVYSAFFDALTQALPSADVGARIVAAPLLETARECPAHMRWPTMLGIAQHHAALGDADVLIGHSMGGYLALQVAASSPSQFKRVVLIDSPIPRSWRSGLLSFSQVTGLSYKFGPAPIANSRRDRWPNRAAAKAHFAHKPFVKRWANGVLDDFITHALKGDGDTVTLTIPRLCERDIYAHVAHAQTLAALHKARNAGVEVTFIAGSESEETRLAGFDANRALFSPRFVELGGVGHLIPFEAPDRAAKLIAAALSSKHGALANI